MILTGGIIRLEEEFLLNGAHKKILGSMKLTKIFLILGQDFQLFALISQVELCLTFIMMVSM